MRKCWNCGEPTEDNDLRVCTDPICGSAALKMRSKYEERMAEKKAKEALSVKKRAESLLKEMKSSERISAKNAASAIKRAEVAEKLAKAALEKLRAYEADAWMVEAEIETTRLYKEERRAERKAAKAAWMKKQRIAREAEIQAALDADAWMVQAEIDTARQTGSQIYLNDYEKEYRRGIRNMLMYDDRLLECPSCGQLSRYHRHNSTLDPYRREQKLTFVATLHCRCFGCGWKWNFPVHYEL